MNFNSRVSILFWDHTKGRAIARREHRITMATLYYQSRRRKSSERWFVWQNTFAQMYIFKTSLQHLTSLPLSTHTCRLTQCTIVFAYILYIHTYTHKHFLWDVPLFILARLTITAFLTDNGFLPVRLYTISCVSISHTHTHMHARTHTQRYISAEMPCFPFLWQLTLQAFLWGSCVNTGHGVTDTLEHRRKNIV